MPRIAVIALAFGAALSLASAGLAPSAAAEADRQELIDKATALFSRDVEERGEARSAPRRSRRHGR